MTWQGSGGNAPDHDGPPGDETRTDWEPPASPGPPASPALPEPPTPPAPWPPAGPVPGGPALGGAWAPPPYAGGGRFAVPGAPGLEYSGALPRFVAYLIDGIILGILGAAIQAAIYAVGLPIAGLSVADAYRNAPAYLAIGIAAVAVVTAVEAAYFVLLWASDGRATLGMRLLKIQVGDATDGRRISKETAFRRWLALGAWLPALAVVGSLAGLANLIFLVWSLVLLVSTISSPTKQGIHDRFANTAMVQPAGGSSNGMVMGCVVILAVLVGLALLSIVALIFLGGQVSDILSAVGESI